MRAVTEHAADTEKVGKLLQPWFPVLTPVEAETNCYKQTFICELCGRTLTRTGEFHEFENGECVLCGKKEFPDEDGDDDGEPSGDGE